MDVFAQVEKNIDQLVEKEVNWARHATAEQLLQSCILRQRQ